MADPLLVAAAALLQVAKRADDDNARALIVDCAVILRDGVDGVESRAETQRVRARDGHRPAPPPARDTVPGTSRPRGST